MIKITCSTTQEQKGLLNSFIEGDYCPFDLSDHISCKYSNGCKECIRKNIEWEVKENDQSYM